MIVSVQFFASHRDVTLCDERSFDVPIGYTTRGLSEVLAQTYPRLAPLLKYSRPAVNEAYCSWEHELRDGDRVAFIPPVSGGSTAF